jgi:hypothetical protein
VAYLNDADKPVPEQGLGAHLRTRLLPHNAGFEIDQAVTKLCAVLIGLAHKPQPHARGLVAHASYEVRSEVLNEAFARAQREGSDKPIQVEVRLRP